MKLKKFIQQEQAAETSRENNSHRDEASSAMEPDIRFIVCKSVIACRPRRAARYAGFRWRLRTPHRTSRLAH